MLPASLFCSVCPSKPQFCDVSHLLTHIGSKGHLSKLNALQIRAHEEDAAAHELTAYDQWFHQNGLALLLSERMHQKEAKSAARKDALKGDQSTNVQTQGM